MFATSRKVIDLARRERRSGNLPEVVLWRVLRTRPGGFKFRRQHPIDAYSLDFACLSTRLAIEIDGETHACGDTPIRDGRLTALGFQTLRIPARNVLTDLDGVVRAILLSCTARQPLHQPSAGPPPRSGEVLTVDENP
ncbi:endonuclease domain-containing protein [Sphingomonas sp. Leaf17]|uniref:endonuclease domain-containing protein n=1 Tax=Sphingomonas sp. Leaf17 TaxID=1735683 RepID=UPI0009EAD778|nr:DUF559 domain-containing protein [Sphingomonas sp. Leaf17]